MTKGGTDETRPRSSQFPFHVSVHPRSHQSLMGGEWDTALLSRTVAQSGGASGCRKATISCLEEKPKVMRIYKEERASPTWLHVVRSFLRLASWVAEEKHTSWTDMVGKAQVRQTAVLKTMRLSGRPNLRMRQGWKVKEWLWSGCYEALDAKLKTYTKGKSGPYISLVQLLQPWQLSGRNAGYWYQETF